MANVLLTVLAVMMSNSSPGVGMNPLMSWLGLDKLSAADLDVRNRVLAQALSGVRDDLHDVARYYQIEPELAGKIAGQYDERLAAIEAERSGSILSPAGLVEESPGAEAEAETFAAPDARRAKSPHRQALDRLIVDW